MSDQTPERGEQESQGAPERPAPQQEPRRPDGAGPQSPPQQSQPTRSQPAQPGWTTTPPPGPTSTEPGARPGQPPRAPQPGPPLPPGYPAQPFPQFPPSGPVPGGAPGQFPGPGQFLPPGQVPGAGTRHATSGRVVPPVPPAPQGGFAAASYPGAPQAAPQQFPGAPVHPAPGPGHVPGGFAQQPYSQAQPYGQVQPYGRPQPYGQPSYPGLPPAEPKGMSIAALVLGIVGVVSGGWFILPQILAVVFGHIGLRKEPSVKGMAIAGLVLGYLMVAVSLVYGIFLALAFSSSSGWD